MSEQKWTPGPWSPGHMTRPDHRCECRYILCKGYMGSIAVISKNDSDNDSPAEDEAIANAHLIAAAPDLAEALQNLMGRLDTPIGRRRIGQDEFFLEAMKIARTALEKATGKSSRNNLPVQLEERALASDDDSQAAKSLPDTTISDLAEAAKPFVEYLRCFVWADDTAYPFKDDFVLATSSQGCHLNIGHLRALTAAYLKATGGEDE